MVNKKILNYINILVIVLIVYISILIISKLCVMKFLYTIFKIISPLFIGIVVAWLLKPIIDYLNNKGMNRIFAIITIYIIIFFLFYIVLMTLIPKFIVEFNEFSKIFPDIINVLGTNIKEDIMCIIDDFVSSIDLSTCKNIISRVLNFLVGLIIGFYLLMDNINIKKYKLLIKFNNIFRGYVRGTLLSALVVFILSTISFYIVGLKGSLLFGFICGITNIIPFIGPYIGALIPVLVSFTKSISFGIIVTVIIFIIQTIEGNIINPFIMSKSVNIHPVTSIMSLIIFEHFFGILGMIFAIPIVAIIKELCIYYYKKYSN